MYAPVNEVQSTVGVQYEHQASTVTTLTLADGSDFPSTGGYIRIGASNADHWALYEYTGKSTNDLTGLTPATLGNVESEATYSFTVGTEVYYVNAAEDIKDLQDGVSAAIHDNVAGEIVAITEKTLPVGADEILIEDSAASNSKKSAKISNLITALLSADLPENVSIQLDQTLSADGKYSGITEDGTAGATLAFGDLCYLAVADSRWELAKADVAATSKGKLGICVLAATGDGEATKMLTYGKVRADTAFPTMTVAAPVFISAATAGDITSTAPTGTTDFVVRIIGSASTADSLFFNPDCAYAELV